MRIWIEEIYEKKGKFLPVRFSHPAGEAMGIWKHRTETPELELEYAAEFTIDQLMDPGGNATKVEPTTPSISQEGEMVYLVGEIEEVEPDGMAHFRLAEDSLTMIESIPGTVKPGDWIRLALRYRDLQVYVY